jgi:hypothetical protein
LPEALRYLTVPEGAECRKPIHRCVALGEGSSMPRIGRRQILNRIDGLGISQGLHILV